MSTSDVVWLGFSGSLAAGLMTSVGALGGFFSLQNLARTVYINNSVSP